MTTVRYIGIMDIYEDREKVKANGIKLKATSPIKGQRHRIKWKCDNNPKMSPNNST
jgi:hypothetical protein